MSKKIFINFLLMLSILSACSSKSQSFMAESVNGQAELITFESVEEDKVFSSNHIDDTGLRIAINQGYGQVIDQTFYDEEHDITVHFERAMTDVKETKLLLTFKALKLLKCTYQN